MRWRSSRRRWTWPAARVVFCDAVAYDAGWVRVEEIAGRVRVRGLVFRTS